MYWYTIYLGCLLLSECYEKHSDWGELRAKHDTLYWVMQPSTSVEPYAEDVLCCRNAMTMNHEKGWPKITTRPYLMFSFCTLATVCAYIFSIWCSDPLWFTYTYTHKVTFVLLYISRHIHLNFNQINAKTIMRKMIHLLQFGIYKLLGMIKITCI